MTNEQYSTAKKLQSDIDTLEDVNYEIMVKRWPAFKIQCGQTECIKSDTLDPTEFSGTEDDLYDSIGTFFEDGVCVKADIEKAVYWYERAIKMGNDLARSNLADILRKGSQGYPKDLKRAFELYKACGLPYAHYRCGEFYEHGWGIEKDLEKAKTYYTLAYKEGHGLARKKLKGWNFLD